MSATTLSTSVHEAAVSREGGTAPRKAVATSADDARRVALIGVDSLGAPMASNLLSAGHHVMVFDPTSDDLTLLATQGAHVASSIADACSSADAVITMFVDDDDTETAVLGTGGVVEVLPANAVHICSSRISVACSDRLVEAHWDAGQRYISAPILDPPGHGPFGQLSLVAGGCERVILEVQSLLNALGEVTARLYGWPSFANALQQELAQAR